MVFNFAARYDARMPTLFVFKKRAPFYIIKHATTLSNYSFKLAGKVLGAAVEMALMAKTPSTIRSAGGLDLHAMFFIAAYARTLWATGQFDA